jgi:glycosyltransferase involved in cell wall biosynthesis
MQGARQNPWDLLRFFAQQRQRGILHLHTGDSCLPRQALLAMRLLRYPRAFVTIHSPYDALRPGEARANFWAKAVARQCHTVCCPSNRSSQLQRNYGLDPVRVETIPNGVDIARYRGGNPSVAWQTLGVAPNTPLVVFTSRLDPQKRPEDALNAFASIADQFTDALLVFVGGGSLEQSLKERAIESGLGERVRFVGHQNNIPDWLAATTVWTLPTESENFSLAVLEALAAGCPILTTLCPGNDEILIDGDNALTVPVGDTAALAQGMRRLLADASLRQRISAGAARCIGHYSAERMIERYIATYRRARPDFC